MLTIKEVEHLAKLAKLDMTEAEKEKYAKQISSILIYFEQLDEVDLSGVSGMNHITGLQNVSRLDEVHQPYSADDMLAAAPDVDGRMVRVKSTLKHK
jgi:aspartyl-tRNA(Asn)/glutamyl-tRNA(Gln) amidotransferase subunit C